MTTRLQTLATESQVPKALVALFWNRSVGIGGVLGALLGWLGFRLTGESFSSQAFLLMLVGVSWGVVGAVIYVGFLQDLEIRMPSLVWFDRCERVDQEGPEVELEPMEEAPPLPPPPAPRRRAATTASRPAPAQPAEGNESAFDVELATG